MPIQPLSINKYNQIPENEDVTPVDGPLEKRVRRSIKATIIITIACLIAIFAAIYTGYTSIYKLQGHVHIYQTSKTYNDMLTEMDPWLLMRRGFYVDNINFGNVKCSESINADKDQYACGKSYQTSRVIVDSSKHYQTVLGFGGAFTEASAYNFYKLPRKVQEKVIQLYFGPNGIGFTLGRIHINSCDFCLSSYSFDDIPGDYDLKYFDEDVIHDTKQIIPFIKRAMDASPNPINLLASPWSPPAWMKVPQYGNQSMTGSATPSGLIADPRNQQSWANYISKFITSYAKYDINIWAITPQNEPEFAAPWEACAYNASFQSDFINNYLGPTIKGDHPDILILAYDHNKDILPHWTSTIIGNDKGYVDGMAFHWYIYNDDRYLDGSYGYDAVNYSYHFAPDKILLATEGCSCPNVLIDNWSRAERLIHDITFDMLNYAQGWIDWNLIVDSEGGPNHLNNYCDASIITLQDYSDIHIQPKFYYFGHYSKFVRPGDVRVKSTVVGNYNFRDTEVNVKSGTEVQIFPCERSVRQQWIFSSNFTLGLTKLATDGFSEWSKYFHLCLAGHGAHDRPYLQLENCPKYAPEEDVLQLELTTSDMLVDKASGQCVTVADGNTVGGGLLILSTCRESTAANYIDQQWIYHETTGELTTKVHGLCLTAGWPFLTGAAFKSIETLESRSNIKVIVMNEADISTEIILHDVKIGEDLRFGISDRSIQTIVY